MPQVRLSAAKDREAGRFHGIAWDCVDETLLDLHQQLVSAPVCQVDGVLLIGKRVGLSDNCFGHSASLEWIDFLRLNQLQDEATKPHAGQRANAVAVNP
ncbi:hypothetical protein GCM10027344_31980 [Spelaeicoccus albus]